jgi:hypothetical protein
MMHNELTGRRIPVTSYEHNGQKMSRYGATFLQVVGPDPRYPHTDRWCVEYPEVGRCEYAGGLWLREQAGIDLGDYDDHDLLYIVAGAYWSDWELDFATGWHRAGWSRPEILAELASMARQSCRGTLSRGVRWMTQGPHLCLQEPRYLKITLMEMARIGVPVPGLPQQLSMF